MTSKNNDNQLDQATIETIKKDLLAQREEVLKDISGVGGGQGAVKFPEYGEKLDENAQEIGEYTANLATDKVLESSLRDIEGALKRIEDGTYGICKYCKKDIGKKRMLARPVASACVECKTKLQSI
jgi:DnaK suppressor protein